jgi:urease accessory protein
LIRDILQLHDARTARTLMERLGNDMRHGTLTRLGFAVSGLLAAAGPVAAHHPTGGMTPSTFMEGFLSGIGHPVIGIDHLAFIIAIGIAAAFTRGGFGIVTAFIAASTVGVLAHVAELNIPLVEPLVAASVIVAGAALAAGMTSAPIGWLVLAAIAGLFHGYAFGETAVGAERGVIGAYLLGLAFIQAAIAGGVMLVSQRFLLPLGSVSMPMRAAGAIVASLGVILLAGGLTGA